MDSLGAEPVVPDSDGNADVDEVVLGEEEVDDVFVGSAHAPSRSNRRSLFSVIGLDAQERWL